MIRNWEFDLSQRLYDFNTYDHSNQINVDIHRLFENAKLFHLSNQGEREEFHHHF